MDAAAIIRSFAQAIADFNANTPPPASSTSPGNLAGLLRLIAPLLLEAAGAIESHPGAITGIDDVLVALKTQGVSWAADLEAELLATPGALEAMQKWLPWVISFIQGNEFEAAPTGIPGGWSGARGHAL